MEEYTVVTQPYANCPATAYKYKSFTSKQAALDYARAKIDEYNFGVYIYLFDPNVELFQRKTLLEYKVSWAAANGPWANDFQPNLGLTKAYWR